MLREHRQGVERLLREHDLRPLLVLLSARGDGYPDFLTPSPASSVGEIEAELALIRATPPARAAHEIGHCLEGRSGLEPPTVGRLLRSSEASAQLAGPLEVLWGCVVAPSWPRLRDLLERDVLYRSRVLAQRGLVALFSDLEPLVTLQEQRLLVALHTNAKQDLGGNGLRLMPSAFVWRGLAILGNARRR